MASGAVTVPLRDLERIRLYVTDKKEALTASQVRKRTGADVVVNGTLFDPERWVPNCDVKADGKVLNDDPYTYRGLGWNSGEGKFHIAVSGEMESYDNFVSGVLLLWQGKPYPYHADAAVSRRSGRSVLLGLTDGSYLLRCFPDGALGMTPGELQRTLLREFPAADWALMLDGGGSVQLSQEGEAYLYSPAGCITTSASGGAKRTAARIRNPRRWCGREAPATGPAGSSGSSGATGETWRWMAALGRRASGHCGPSSGHTA